MNKDLTFKGTVNFWVRLQENPHFKQKGSNISFMNGKEMGGVTLTVVKEQAVLRVVLHNSRYGVARIASDISDKLIDDMMVTITWDSRSTKLYLNGEITSESPYTED